jgi:hypothetical protein
MSLGLKSYRRILTGTVLSAVLAGTAACTKERLVQGECKPFNGVNVCTWGRMSGKTLVAFGATVPVGAIENAPPEVPMAWPPKMDAMVALPAAVDSAVGFKNLTIYWEPHGHPPGPYLVPHFDFHFNNISAADLAKVDCADSAKPAVLPGSYELPDVTIPQLGTLVGICVPGMGMHALPGAELHDTTSFQKTMVVGYYHKWPIFVEPMITRATLLERKSFQIEVLDVPGEPAGVILPARFEAVYDSTAHSYEFTFLMPTVRS